MKKSLFPIVAALCLAVSCRESMDALTERVFETASIQFQALAAQIGPEKSPRSFEGGKHINSPLEWWCSGFFPGSLWYVYSYTGDPAIKALAERETHKLDSITSMATHHDIGFQVNCSFGNAYRITGDESWLPVIESAAAKLARRYSPVTGVIKSWESNPGKDMLYPVIIDNMMNLELLEFASKQFSCDSLGQIAVAHARTTIANHFRPDFSTWHLVDYSPTTGAVRYKHTFQGYSDDSAWARGQAWALYGYTMMYRETGKEEFLKQAEGVAQMLADRLPEDGIPY